YTFSNVQASHTIAATFAIIPYTIDASAGSNGSITDPGSSVVNCGGSKTYTITADACYSVTDVLVDNASVGATASYMFSNVQANHTGRATCRDSPYTIDASAGTSGAISDPGSSVVS